MPITLTLKTLRESTHNTVSDIDLLKYANLALMLGLKEGQLPKLFNSAIRLGYAVGITSKKSIESLSKGIARQSYLILDNIGITFRATKAWEWYEESKGFTRLNADQKKEAWKQYAIKLVIEKSQDLEIDRVKATQDKRKSNIENLKAEYGKDLVQKESHRQ